MAQQDVLDYIRKTPHNSNVNVVKSMLDSLGGSSLPEVTNEDNGKVLTVVEGEWDKADASGGGAGLVVHIITAPTEGYSDRHALDKTFGEIEQTVLVGGAIWLISDENDTTSYAPPSDISLQTFNTGTADYYLASVTDKNGLQYMTEEFETESEAKNAVLYENMD